MTEKMDRYTFRLPNDMWHAVEDEAKRKGITSSDIVRMALSAGLPIIQGNEPATLKKTNELLEKMLRIMSNKDKEYAEVRKEAF